MKHVDPLLVLRENVGTMARKEVDHVHVAPERGEVERSEAVVAQTLRVDPRFEILLLFFAFAFENNALITGGSAVPVGQCLTGPIADIV